MSDILQKVIAVNDFKNGTAVVSVNQLGIVTNHALDTTFNQTSEIAIQSGVLDDRLVNTDTTYTAGTGISLNGTVFDINLVDGTTQTTAAESVTTTANRTYSIQTNASDQLVVNVPWEGGAGGSGISNVVEDTTPQLGGTLDANGNIIDMGTYTITDAKVGEWDTAYGWGNHSTAGYLSSVVEDTTPQLGGHLDCQSYHVSGVGLLELEGAFKTILQSNTDGATVTFDLNAANTHTVTLGGNRILALSNASAGQRFVIRLVQDGIGSHTVTWFSTIKWPGGLVPTLTTTGGKTDVFGFICTSAGNYDGFVIGYNL